MHKLLLVVIAVVLFQNTYSQSTTHKISGEYQNLTFDAFVKQVESSSSYTFFYLPEWCATIEVNEPSKEIDLEKLLNKLLLAKDIKFYIDDYQNIILYKGQYIADYVPNLQQEVKTSDEVTGASEPTLTGIEKRYVEGKRRTTIETFVVGDRNNTVHGKKNIVSGRIVDKLTGEPLIGATVFVKELSLGASTDLDGYFNLVLEEGKYYITASSLSMRQKNFYMDVFSAGNIEIALDKELVNINEVRVVADRHDNVSGMQMGYERISNKELKEIPAVMGEKDLLKVAQMLPGVQSAGEGSAGIYVRGGSADQNGFYINKLPIYNTSHMLGFFSAFSPDIVNNFSLYKSNIPSQYGGRVSSVFDISTRQGNKKEFYGKGGISPITAHMAIEGPIVKDKSSFVLSYRGTYSDWILRQIDDYDIQNSNASFYDISANVNTELNKKNILKVFAYKSYDQFSLAASDQYKYSTMGATIGLKHRFSSSLSADMYLISSDYGFDHNNISNPSEAYHHKYTLKHHEAKADFLLLTSISHRVSFGGSGVLYDLNRGNIEPFNEESSRIPVSLGEELGFEGALYASDEFTLGARLSIAAGLRYSFYSFLGPQNLINYYDNSAKEVNNIIDTVNYSSGEIVKTYSGPEPRVALNYRLGMSNSVKASYNRLRQNIFMLNNAIAVSPTDQWKLADYHLKPVVADQVSLGYYHDIPEKGLVSSLEVYRKWTKNVAEYKDGIDFISSMPPEMLLLQGDQESYGAEMMLKKNTGKLTGWLSYAYSSSSVLVNNATTGEQINGGKRYPSNFDRPHSLNFVSNYKYSRRISFSTTLVYSTGRPITYPMAVYYIDNKEVLHYSARNEYRIPDYFRIDMSLIYEGNLASKKWLHSTWMLNVYNLTGRRNAYSVYFEANEGKIQGYRLSIFGQPIITLSWNFKFGNYVSE